MNRGLSVDTSPVRCGYKGMRLGRENNNKLYFKNPKKKKKSLQVLVVLFRPMKIIISSKIFVMR